MIPHHVYYQLAILGLLWLCVILHYFWPRRSAMSSTTGRTRAPHVQAPTRQRTQTLRGPDADTSLCRVCTRGQPSHAPASTATRAHAADQSTPMCHRHLHALLPPYGL